MQDVYTASNYRNNTRSSQKDFIQKLIARFTGGNKRGGGGGQGRNAQAPPPPPPPVFWTGEGGGAQGAPRNGTSTCILTTWTICDIMNSIESSKIMLSEVRQLLHITLTIPITSATAERTFSAMRRFENTRKKQTYMLYLMKLEMQMKELR